MSTFIKIFFLFDNKHKLFFFSLLFLGLFNYFLELLTLSSLLPLINVLMDPEGFKNSKYALFFLKFLNFFNINFDIKELIELVLIIFFILFLLRTFFSIFFIHFQNIINVKLTIFTQSKFYDFFTKQDKEHSEVNSFPIFLRIFEGDTTRLINYLQLHFEIFLDLLFILSVLVILSQVSLNITLIAFIFLFLTVAIVIFLTRKTIKNLSIKRQYYSTKSNEIIQQIFGISIFIRILKKQKFFKDKFIELISKRQFFENKKKILVKSPKFLIEFFIAISFLILIYFFNNYVSAFEKKQFLPTLAFLLIAILRISPIANKLSNSFQEIKYAKVSADFLFKLLNRNLERDDIKSSENISDFNIIKFEKVNFEYGALQIFNNLNFEIKRGQKIGLISPSGSGKSTFLSLLLGVLKTSKGKIMIDNEEYKNISQISKNFFGYVPQRSFYFNSTIEENVALGEKKNKINKNFFLEVLNHVGINEISFGNNFLKKTLGENGSNFSGGQLQRIAIARSLYFKPKVLILDEALSQLDKESEEKIFTNIINNFKDLTIIIVSHNFSKIKSILNLYEIKNLNLLKIQS